MVDCVCQTSMHLTEKGLSLGEAVWIAKQFKVQIFHKFLLGTDRESGVGQKEKKGRWALCVKTETLRIPVPM